MVFENRTRFFLRRLFAFLTIFCFITSYSTLYADGPDPFIYYVYPPKDVSDERLESIIERWKKLQEDVKEEISSERQTKYRQTSYEATNNDLFSYFRELNEKRPDWFNPEQWENVDLKDCSLWLGSIAIIVEDEPKRFVEGSRFFASPIKEFGIPVRLEGLQRTKTWKEKHADHMIFILDMDYIIEKGAESEVFLSFKNWLIENTSIYTSGNNVNIDLSNSLLLNVKLRGSQCFANLKELIVTRNFELGNIDDFTLLIDFPAGDKSPFLPKNWIYDGFLCYNRATRKIEIPPGISREQFATSVLDNSIEYDREVFAGIKPKDLYSTNAYRRGDLTGVKFFPKRIKGVDYSLQGWNLSKLNLVGACFDGLDLTDVDFTDSIISDAAFEDVRGLTMEQITTTWNWKAKRMDSVVLPPELEKAVSERLSE